LRKFIDAEPPQPAADRSNPGVIGHFENRPVHFIQNGQFMLPLFCVGRHRAKLIHDKGLAVQTAPELAEKNRPRGTQPDQEPDHKQRKEEHYQKHQSADRVEQLFRGPLPGSFRHGAEDEHGTAIKFIQSGLGNPSLEKIGHEPDLDSFDLASLDEFLDLSKVNMLCAQDDSIG
jgi:hypothetical protein